MKFVISSHKNYIDTTEGPLIDTLLKSGINLNDIYIFVGGYDINGKYEKISDTYNKFSAPHNSMDFTGLISVLEMNIESEFWFLLHDTCYVGPKFYNTIKHLNHHNLNTVALTFDVSMNMGSYRWSYMQEKKEQILSYKNTSDDLQFFKNKLINEEDIFLNPKIESYCKKKRITSGPTDYYNNNTQRIIEYFPDIDLHKIKANWCGKSHYEVKL